MDNVRKFVTDGENIRIIKESDCKDGQIYVVDYPECEVCNKVFNERKNVKVGDIFEVICDNCGHRSEPWEIK